MYLLVINIHFQQGHLFKTCISVRIKHMNVSDETISSRKIVQNNEFLVLS